MSGVYRINCDNCDSEYIGKTARNFKIRFKEHVKDPNSNIYQHLKDNNHKISCIENNLEIIHNNTDDRTLRVLENIEIRRAVLNNSPLINAQIDICKSASTLADLCCNLT